MLVIDAIFLQTNKKHVRPTKQINIFESSLIRYKVILQKKIVKESHVVSILRKRTKSTFDKLKFD